MGWATDFKEWLLPSETFQKSEDRDHDLLVARVLVFLFYSALGGVFLYTLLQLFVSGRIEVIRSGYKLDVIEAPSVAICPFWAKTKVTLPADKSKWATAEITSMHGTKRIDIEPFVCSYDRDCVCVDLFKHKGANDASTTSLSDYITEKGKSVGFSGDFSSRETKFRDHVEIRTMLTDPSGDETLKIGLYDSVDPSPNWVYINQGEYSMGTLELATWTVTDMSLRGVRSTLDGDWKAMAKPRHIFRYTSQEVGRRGAYRQWNETSINYEMKNFFVDDTVSSETAFSGYTLAFLLFLILTRSVAIAIFFEAVLPEYVEKKDREVQRELSGVARGISFVFRPCSRRLRGGPAEQEPPAAAEAEGERRPLLGEQGTAGQ